MSAESGIHFRRSHLRSTLFLVSFLASDYATRLTNIKNKTPGNVAGRFFSSGWCGCERIFGSQPLPIF